MRELARAAEKAFASGLGDWHLQPLNDADPKLWRRMLLGPLGPETLKTHHGLSEEACLGLYGLLQRHSAGFQSEAAAAAVADALAADRADRTDLTAHLTPEPPADRLVSPGRGLRARQG